MIQKMGIVSALMAVSLLAVAGSDLRVTQVQVLFRHGERTPTIDEIYPNDVHSVSEYEPWGLGQLTNEGKMREYRVGQLLRTRYQDLLGPLYVPRAVYAVSSDRDRTKMSLQLVLAGLFPPSEAETWNSELPWMPIPTHYAPEPLDIILKSDLCPQFEDEVAQIMQLPDVQAKIAEQNDLFRFLTVKTGRNLTELKPVYQIYNLLVAQKAMNLTWPEWCTDTVFEQMGEIFPLQHEIWSYTTDAKRLSGGSMVRQFIENMFLNRTEKNPRKIYLYSAHDSNLSLYLRAQGIFEPKIPLYGAAIMIEKLLDNDGKIYVRLVLWTGVTEELITLRIPGCEEVCPIETYLQLTSEVVPSDEEMDCHWRRLSNQELRSVFDEEINEH